MLKVPAALTAAVVLLAVGPAPAGASCASKAVKAAGRPAILESAARSKARSAWIRKVTASRKHGPAYAAWLRAREPSYACKKAGRQHVCEASAVPCKH